MKPKKEDNFTVEIVVIYALLATMLFLTLLLS